MDNPRFQSRPVHKAANKCRYHSTPRDSHNTALLLRELFYNVTALRESIEKKKNQRERLQRPRRRKKKSAMVVDTTYYDALGVSQNATELQIKKAYRKLAITTHPDKNPGDETAHARFQAIGEAYQVLSNDELRKRYDKFGKEEAVPGGGFEDPAEFFGMIFGGEAFVDLIGELSLMKDLTKTMDIQSKQMEEEKAAEAAEEKLKEKDPDLAQHQADVKMSSPSPERPSKATSFGDSDLKPPMPDKSTTSSGASTPRRNLGQQAIMDKSEEDARMDAAGLTSEEKELRKKEKKKGLTKEQREELAAYEAERKRIRDERVDTLAKKLLDRISIWTETDKGKDVTKAFQEKTRLECESLKMESFGLEILHTVGTTYLQKATSFLKSQKFLGVSGFFSRMKDRGTWVKDTWSTISTAIDAQLTMEEMAKMEEKGGEDWTDEKKAEYERRVTGKILAAAWKGSRFEIQSVLRDVCDKVLNDKSVKLEKRIERAHALTLCGTVYQQAQRDPEEEGDYMAFEQLMADAAIKKGKDEKKDSKKAKKPDEASPSHHLHHHGHHPHAAAV